MIYILVLLTIIILPQHKRFEIPYKNTNFEPMTKKGIEIQDQQNSKGRNSIQGKDHPGVSNMNIRSCPS